MAPIAAIWEFEYVDRAKTKGEEMAILTGAHLFIRCLKLEGIQKIFTIVGDTILPLVDAAAAALVE